MTPITTYHSSKRQLALILPAHNEEVVLGATIRSAIAAGQDPQDIYVVSDGSADATLNIAEEILGYYNVMGQPQGGKANAIWRGLQFFDIASRYTWVHVADADGAYSPTYFTELKNRLNPDKYVAATGHLQSLKGGWISKYRLYEYTLGLEVMRRVQRAMNAIPVIPGATCVLRTDILSQLDFSQHSLTEDMDLTIQIHRKKLGKIAYIPQAKAFTQDPKDFGDYFKQIMRWYRGAWQVMGRHRIGLRPQKIDIYMGYMLLEEIVLLLELTLVPLWAWWGQHYNVIAYMFLNDFLVFFGITIWAAWLNRRQDIVPAFPLFYMLRFVNLFAFFRAWFEIVVQRKFRSDKPGWTVAGRRYRIATDVALATN